MMLSVKTKRPNQMTLDHYRLRKLMNNTLHWTKHDSPKNLDTIVWYECFSSGWFSWYIMFYTHYYAYILAWEYTNGTTQPLENWNFPWVVQWAKTLLYIRYAMGASSHFLMDEIPHQKRAQPTIYLVNARISTKPWKLKGKTWNIFQTFLCLQPCPF